MEAPEVSISIDWLASIMEEHSDTNFVKNQSPSPRIQKVPSRLGQVDYNHKCYVPSVVSIGPYHHGNQDLAAVETLKPKIAYNFAQRCGKTVSDMSDKFTGIACLARNCYAEESTDSFNDSEFAKMMFLDGCFILHFIDGQVNGNRRDIQMKRDMLAYVQRDLFLLENQLPFLVLEALMSFMTLEEHQGGIGIQMLNRFVEHTRALPPSAPLVHQAPTMEQTTDTKQNPCPVHLLDLLHQQLIEKKTLPTICQLTNPTDWYCYRSVNELKATGINFRASETSRFTDIKYETGFVSGNLRLPPMTIDDSTKSILLNLVAYETCPDAPDDSAVTSYICFMDSLIDHAEDVRELRSKGILLNFLGSDQQVADLFNEISNDLVPNPLLYGSVKGLIEKHYKNRCKIWISEWLHAHFRTPWAFLAFLAAVFAIALTVTQTYYAANPPKN